MKILQKDRTAFERGLLTELRLCVKGSGWKLNRTALFKEKDGIYRQVMLSVHSGARETLATLGMKPMSLDPLLWDILAIPENHDQSLSFRSWGAFTCQALPIEARQVETDSATPADVAAAIMILCQEADGIVDQALQRGTFSALVESHPNQTATRKAYAITLVTSLIEEGKLCEARAEAGAYATGSKTSVISMTSRGKSFHQLALDWLDARLTCP